MGQLSSELHVTFIPIGDKVQRQSTKYEMREYLRQPRNVLNCASWPGFVPECQPFK